MKILEIYVKGFRSLKKVTWKPGDLNVVIGPNGCGKSNILRFLELISASAQGRLGEYVKCGGGIDPLLWDGKVSEIELRVVASPIDGWRSEEKDSLTYEATLAQVGKSGGYRIDHELLGNYYKVKTGERNEPFKLIDRHNLQARVFDPDESALVVPAEEMSEEETVLSLAAGPFA